MTATATVVVADDEDPGHGSVPLHSSFLDSMIGRLQAEYGMDRRDLHPLATEVLGMFATARIQAFVPILVEKRLRSILRGQDGTRSGVRRAVLPDGPAVAAPAAG
jgi:hypothetical protein